MLHHFHTPRFPDGTPEVIQRFAAAIGGVLEAIGRAFNPNPNPPVPGLVIYHYIRRTQARFIVLITRLITRLLAGLPARTRAPRKPREKPAQTERKTPRLRLPSRRAWLAHEIGWFGRNYASGIAHTLNQPETAALIASSPQAQRLLRPLCRMLGLTVPAIPALPRRPRKPRPKPAPKPRRLTRKQREAILWYPNSEGKPMKLLPRRLPRD